LGDKLNKIKCPQCGFEFSPPIRDATLDGIIRDGWFMHLIMSVDPKMLYEMSVIACSIIFDYSMKDYWIGIPEEDIPNTIILSFQHKCAIARFLIEKSWTEIEESERMKWSKFFELWNSNIYKNVTWRDVIIARVKTDTTGALAEKLGLTYNIVYSSILGRLKNIEDAFEVGPLFWYRNSWVEAIKKWKERTRYEDVESIEEKPKPIGEDDLFKKFFRRDKNYKPNDSLFLEFVKWLEGLSEDDRSLYPDFKRGDLWPLISKMFDLKKSDKGHHPI